MKVAQGAHIVPYSKGGKTEWNNLVVVSAEHNRKMGDMNAYDYKDIYQRQVAKAA
jgi:5-methylcytosine-specific restriction endonuclease McrA